MLDKVTIVGGGSWATALVKIFSESHVWVEWLVRDQDTAQFIMTRRHNPRYLSYVALDTTLVNATVDPIEAIVDSDLVIFAVPSAYFQDTIDKLDKKAIEDKRLAVSIKGFITGTGCTPSEFLVGVLEKRSAITVLGGPCHAEEIAANRCTYLTIGSSDTQVIRDLHASLQSPYLNTVSNADPVGIEYAAILKNITGIATGIAGGLNYGDNFQAVLVCNAMKEANAFLNCILPAERDLCDSAYFGDLLVTAYSDHSRNRTLGKLIGKGMIIRNAIEATGMIAEGFYAARELNQLVNKLPLSLPVMTCVYRILHQHANPYQEFKLLEKKLR